MRKPRVQGVNYTGPRQTRLLEEIRSYIAYDATHLITTESNESKYQAKLFYKKNNPIFPNFSSLAKKIVSVTATSVPLPPHYLNNLYQ
jgi:hypothetical protein